MALELILVRHAKSSWDSPDLADHDRPLNARGVASAIALGNWLRDKGYEPGQALCSSALRTRETLARMAMDVPTTVTEKLYHAGAYQMLRVLHAATANSVILVGHNPGIGELAERLARTLPRHPRFLDYPTGATTVFRFDVDRWEKVDFAAGEIVDFIVPRDLPGMN